MPGAGGLPLKSAEHSRQNNGIVPLDKAALAAGTQTLAARDADLAGIAARHGVPPLWAREPGFATLAHIILEQQVSLASAKAAFEKLAAVASPLLPANVLRLDDQTLRNAGVSRQKARYLRFLSQSIIDSVLDLDALHHMEDTLVRDQLIRVKGIGRWTAEVYLLMALRRPDAWPVGDLALAKAIQRLKQLPALPDAAQLESLGNQWRPWRSVAARLLWQFYLNEMV